jgi:hypothetical protein
VEYEADVRPGGRDLSKIAPFAARFAAFTNGSLALGMTFAKSSVKIESPPRVRRHPKGLSQNKRLGRKDSGMRQQRNERIRKSRCESGVLASSLAG